MPGFDVKGKNVSPTPSYGSFGAWDFRILHRGLPNAGNSVIRSVVYFTIANTGLKSTAYFRPGNQFPAESLFEE